MFETRWYLIRHAPVDNPDGKIYGAADLSANTCDSAAFESLANKLPKGAVSVISHLIRSRQTLDALVRGGLVVQKPLVDPRLGEQDFGDWTGKTYDEARSIYGEAYDRFWLAPVTEKPPNGESFLDVINRVADCITELSERFKGREIVCIAHGGSIRAAIAIALRLKPEQAIRFSTDNLSTTLLNYLHPEPGFRGGWKVTGTNIPIA
ncbi:MAG: phosphoglycerate mutase [Rhodospirillaceae bacterium]|nr:phosphoglycerate mutase [Rhodospirillaceae bacterium]|tara:strand:- start:3248 stop:3868 length:621 start_codon:yes stop_codon:yes gene_type:complete